MAEHLNLDHLQLRAALKPGGAISATWAANITKARLRKKLKQDDLAAMCGLAPSTIYRLEANEAKVSLLQMILVSDALGSSPARMFAMPNKTQLQDYVHEASDQ